jgi:hypothetical protein
MTSLLPPVEISRTLLLLFVAAGAVVSIAASGTLSAFAGGFAAGAGAAFVIARLKRPEEAPEPGPDGEVS